MAYKLLDKNCWKEITISSDLFAKQNFMDMMGWTEEEFRNKTIEFVSDEELINKAYIMNTMVISVREQMAILAQSIEDRISMKDSGSNEENLKHILHLIKEFVDTLTNCKLPSRTIHNGEILRE